MKDVEKQNERLLQKSEELKYMSIDLLTKIEYLKKKRIVMKSKNEKLRVIYKTMKRIYNTKTKRYNTINKK